MSTVLYSFVFHPHNRQRGSGRLLPVVTVSCLMTCQLAFASGEYEFDPNFLQGGVPAAELAKFARGNAVLPGTYLADIVMNNDTPVAREDVVFTRKPGKDNAEPCLTVALLDRVGVDMLKLTRVDTKDRRACVDIAAQIQSSSVSFDSGEQRLLINVPQASLRRSVQGYVDPSQWDRGVTAGMLTYGYNSFYSSAQSVGTQSHLSLDGGVNLGDWRFRSNSSLDWDRTKRSWQSRALYAQRDIQALSSQLTLGDSTTSGNLFDSFSLRGVQVASDDRMLPDAQTGYAPVVRGQANTNAKVTIRQNGYTIYETTVSPGPFEISDLYPSGSGGDLDVTVTEGDGQIRKFSVPYASVVHMLRPGAHRYSAALGQYRSGLESEKRMVGQLTYERGLSNLFTGYTGIVAAEGYLAPMVGTAMNTPIGAFGFDVTHASTRLPGDASTGGGMLTGQSSRVSYSKALPQTGSSVSIAAYRYSTSGYYNVQDAMRAMKGDRAEDLKKDPVINTSEDYVERFERHYERKNILQQRQRNTFQVTLNQSLGDMGSLYGTASSSNYWNQSGSSTQYQLGYSGSTRYFSYAISAMRSMDQSGKNDDQLYVSMSIPLGSRTSASSSVSFNKNGAGVRGAVNTTMGLNNEYNWGASADRSELGSKSVTTYGSFKGSQGTLNASMGSGDGYQQASWGASGSVVAHPGGITFGQSVNDTFAIVEADGAEGAAITSQPGVKINTQGYAVVPYLTPYRRNSVDVDPRGMSTDVELKSTSLELIPRAGAVLMAKFETVTGRAAVIDLQTPEGMAVPFGTQVTTADGSAAGVVGQGGQVMARGLEPAGTLIIKWGETAAQQCHFAYVLSPLVKGTKQTRFEHFSAPCDPTGPDVRITVAEQRR